MDAGILLIGSYRDWIRALPIGIAIGEQQPISLLSGLNSAAILRYPGSALRSVPVMSPVRLRCPSFDDLLSSSMHRVRRANDKSR